jgi:HEPN domain-containing protein
MDFQPKDYYEAASDRMDQADLLYSLDTEYCQGLEDRRYALVVYSAGLAVECMLRAYIRRMTNKVNSRHDLSRLFVESRLDTRVVEHGCAVDTWVGILRMAL